MKDDLLRRLGSLACDAAEEGYSTFGSALASLGAVFAVCKEAEAAKLLAPLSQQAADGCTRGLRTDTVSLDSDTKLSVLAVSS